MGVIFRWNPTFYCASNPGKKDLDTPFLGVVQGFTKIGLRQKGHTIHI